MSVDEARRQSTQDALSEDCQFFFAMGGGFSAGFRLRKGGRFIIVSLFPLGLGIKCFGAAFWTFRL